VAVAAVTALKVVVAVLAVTAPAQARFSPAPTPLWWAQAAQRTPLAASAPSTASTALEAALAAARAPQAAQAAQVAAAVADHPQALVAAP